MYGSLVSCCFTCTVYETSNSWMYGWHWFRGNQMMDQVRHEGIVLYCRRSSSVIELVLHCEVQKFPRYLGDNYCWYSEWCLMYFWNIQDVWDSHNFIHCACCRNEAETLPRFSSGNYQFVYHSLAREHTILNEVKCIAVCDSDRILGCMFGNILS